MSDTALMLEFLWVIFAVHWPVTLPLAILALAVGWARPNRWIPWALLVLFAGNYVAIPLAPNAARGSDSLVYLLLPFCAIAYVMISYALGGLIRFVRNRLGG